MAEVTRPTDDPAAPAAGEDEAQLRRFERNCKELESGLCTEGPAFRVIRDGRQLAARLRTLHLDLALFEIALRQAKYLRASLEQALEQRDAELTNARAALAKVTERRFPIMGGPSIPWSMLASYTATVKQNHGQSLERLAERGGLSPYEAMCALACTSLSGGRNKWPDPGAELERRRAEYEEHAACKSAVAALVRAAMEWHRCNRDDVATSYEEDLAAKVALNKACAEYAEHPSSNCAPIAVDAARQDRDGEARDRHS